MAVDAQILKLLGEQDKRQSNYRQVSRDYMKNSASVLDSINQSVRYNTSQSNSLKSGLGEITGKLLGEIKSNKKSDNSELSNKSPVIQRLDDIKNILNKQYDLIDKYINNQFESDETKLNTKEEEKEEEKEKEPIEEKKSSLFKSLGLGLGALGAGLAAFLIPLLEPVSRLFTTLQVVGSKALGAIKSAGSKAWNKLKSVSSKAWSNIKSGSAKLWTNMKTGMGKFVSRLKGNLSSAVNSIKTAASKIGNTIKNISGSIKTGASKIASLAGSAVSKVGDMARSAARGVASKAGDIATSTRSGLKNIAGKAGGLAKSIPGVGAAAKMASGAKFVFKKLPFISAAFEGMDAKELASMSPEDREAYLQKQKDEINQKGILGRALYGLNNNVKTLTAFGSEMFGAAKATVGIAQGNLQTQEMEAILVKRKAEKEAQKNAIEPIDETERDRQLRENINRYFEERMQDEEYRKNLPQDPATVINQTNITMPGEDYGTTIRRGSK